MAGASRASPYGSPSPNESHWFRRKSARIRQSVDSGSEYPPLRSDLLEADVTLRVLSDRGVVTNFQRSRVVDQNGGVLVPAEPIQQVG